LSNNPFDLSDIGLKEDKRQRENVRVVKRIVKLMESTIDKNYIQIFNNWGSGMGKSGRPDLEIVFNYQTWYVEAKDPKGNLSTTQKARIRIFGNTGVTIYVVDDADDFKNRLWKLMLKNAPKKWYKED